MIESPNDRSLGELCRKIEAVSARGDRQDLWPEDQLQLCADAGVFGWFVPREYGGSEWSTEDLVRGYLALSAVCLTTAFAITQRTAACRRIAGGSNEALKSKYLPPLATGGIFATVGISHLTTSHRHVGRPVLEARPAGDGGDGYCVDGFSPWVTGGNAADVLVLGATMADGREILFASEVDGEIVKPLPGHTLAGLTGSCTGRVNVNGLFVDEGDLIGGPAVNVLSNFGGGAGGFQTSALALGLSRAAIDFIETQAEDREWLGAGERSLREQHEELVGRLMKSAAGAPVCSNEELRFGANSIALRATQAALIAAKGAGYVKGHPAGRWCREALFFLVWSCPTAVSQAGLCELAGIE